MYLSSMYVWNTITSVYASINYTVKNIWVEFYLFCFVFDHAKNPSVLFEAADSSAQGKALNGRFLCSWYNTWYWSVVLQNLRALNTFRAEMPPESNAFRTHKTTALSLLLYYFWVNVCLGPVPVLFNFVKEDKVINEPSVC